MVPEDAEGWVGIGAMLRLYHRCSANMGYGGRMGEKDARERRDRKRSTGRRGLGLASLNRSRRGGQVVGEVCQWMRAVRRGGAVR